MAIMGDTTENIMGNIMENTAMRETIRQRRNSEMRHSPYGFEISQSGIMEVSAK
jgi:hypothetical protein